MTTTAIQMPEGIVLDEANYTNTFGRFIIQPLEKGYGITIGSSFRRVLLSSLTGTAVTAINIPGVQHEFSTIHGVVEDVSEMILNLKEISLRAIDSKFTAIHVSLKGPRVVTGADIQAATSEFEIMNPEKHICTLGPEADFEMEMRVGRGRGYVPADENKIPDQPIGMISIDSIFSPIQNVRIITENTRVGGSTDYDKLTLELTTDGSVTPEEALSQSAKILLDHVQMFLNFDISKKDEAEESPEDDETLRIRKILTTSVDDLELSVRSHNCLKAANIKTIADLVRRDEAELLKFRNFGRKSLAELGAIAQEHNLEFGMDVSKYLDEDSSQDAE